MNSEFSCRTRGIDGLGRLGKLCVEGVVEGVPKAEDTRRNSTTKTSLNVLYVCVTIVSKFVGGLDGSSSERLRRAHDLCAREPGASLRYHDITMASPWHYNGMVMHIHGLPCHNDG